MRELEETQNGIAPVPDQSSGEVVDSDHVISERLVVFRNIQELQLRNQELLRVVRELSQQQEAVEVEKLCTAEAELRKRLEETSNELEEMCEARRRQTALVESLVRQRDMLREMVASSSFNSTTQDPCYSATAP